MARIFAGSAVVASTLLLLPSLAYGDGAGPAVSSPNAKISVEGGQYDRDQSVLALWSFVAPVGPSWGMQFDGAFGHLDQNDMGGGGLHVFTRDPSSYLLGLYGSYHTWNGIDIWRGAAEFQVYVNRFTFEGIAGYESVDVPSAVGGFTVLNPDSEHFFTHVDLDYYVTDDLMISGGYRYVSKGNLGAVGVEYFLRDHGSPISLFAKGNFGLDNFGFDDFTRITGGLKVYFGEDPDKSLIARHRTEDPENYTPVWPNFRLETPTEVIVVPPDEGGDEIE